ncbi:MAG TPA: hypothetical protein VFW47_04025 [Phenylobacterium sp.]|nr:hypothetical protein [Phenylobacterium sp.]
MQKATKSGRITRSIDRLKLIFLGLFALITATVLVIHFVWVWPGKQCEAKGDWWDWRTRICAHPIPISDITGRIIADPKDRAEAKAALAAARAKGEKPVLAPPAK